MSSIILSQPQTSSSSSPDYGYFYDTTNQTIASPFNVQNVQIGNTVLTNNVQVSGGQDIVFNNTGKFNIQFQIAVRNNAVSNAIFYFWQNYLGVAVATTALASTVHANGDIVLTGNYFIDVLSAGDSISFSFTATNSNVLIQSISPPPSPSIPTFSGVYISVVSL